MNEKSSFGQGQPSRQAAQAGSYSKPDRRRSQRTLLVMPLAISWTTGTGMRVREHAETEVVSATGAQLRMKTRVPTHGTVEIKRPAANQSATATVVTVSNPGPDGWIRIGVEFTSPNTSFWGINFPPLEALPMEPMPPAKPTLASLLAQRDAAASRAALASLTQPLRSMQSPQSRPGIAAWCSYRYFDGGEVMSALVIQPSTPEGASDQLLAGPARAILETAAREICEIMLGLKLTRIAAEPPVVADVTVLVGFSGQWRGVFGLHCQAHTACRLATLALGADTDEFDERVLDAVGEIANMVAGSFKSKIPGLGENSVLSVPSVISGADYHRHISFGGEHLEVSLSCEGSPIWLTLDLRK